MLVQGYGYPVDRHGSIRSSPAPQAHGGLSYIPVLLVGLGNGQEEGLQGQVGDGQGPPSPTPVGVDGKNIQEVYAGDQGHGQSKASFSTGGHCSASYAHRSPYAGDALDNHGRFPNYAPVLG